FYIRFTIFPGDAHTGFTSELQNGAMKNELILTLSGLYTRQNKPVARLRWNGFQPGIPHKGVAGFFLFTDEEITGSTFAVYTQAEGVKPKADEVYEGLLALRSRYETSAQPLEQMAA
ncbi:MAG: hypothetical protein SFY92_03375, partial [Verrucomicrobiae bacterium]|nr:hypothetical protein [Verrucomicrobiae bacterium]